MIGIDIDGEDDRVMLYNYDPLDDPTGDGDVSFEDHLIKV